MSNHSEQNIATEDKTQTAEEIALELKAEEKPTEDTPSRPEWLPEKFDSPEAMAEAYKSLETKLGAPKDAPAPDASDLSIKKVEADAKEAGVDLDAMTGKYRENGSLEDTDYADLEKAGYKRDQVDKYIAGQEALTKQYESEVMSKVGDADTYGLMTAWAVDHLSAPQVELFNEAVQSGDVERATFAIAGLKARYTEANGAEPARTIDGKPSTTSPRYESEAEWVGECQDPRYWTDQAYREKVERKFNTTWGTP